ncbi:MAG: T9SS type A sorting domain-containing protein, partial [Bacteroidales bacterium]
RVEVQIFPNPTSNILNINSNVEINLVELIDNLCVVIYSMEVHGLNRVQPDVSNIESGLYQVRITTADNSVLVKSFVKAN